LHEQVLAGVDRLSHRARHLVLPLPALTTDRSDGEVEQGVDPGRVRHADTRGAPARCDPPTVPASVATGPLTSEVSTEEPETGADTSIGSRTGTRSA
jgi:hypothetical protein